MKIIPLCINAANLVWENTLKAPLLQLFHTCLTFLLAVKNTTGSASPASQKSRL